MNYILETCADSVQSAIEAKKGGANRIELCSNLVIGGTSPGESLFRQVKEQTGLNAVSYTHLDVYKRQWQG